MVVILSQTSKIGSTTISSVGSTVTAAIYNIGLFIDKFKFHVADPTASGFAGRCFELVNSMADGESKTATFTSYWGYTHLAWLARTSAQHMEFMYYLGMEDISGNPDTPPRWYESRVSQWYTLNGETWYTRDY